MRPPRTSLLLLPAGLALGHAFGYLVAGPGHHTPTPVAHQHLALVVRLGLPLAAAVVLAAFAGGARRHDPRPPALAPLAAQMVGLFVVVELVEHALAGVGPAHVLASPTTRWGVVGQVLAAWLVRAVVRTAHSAGRLVAPGKPESLPGRALRRFPRPAGERPVGRDAAATWALLRAPPVAVA